MLGGVSIGGVGVGCPGVVWGVNGGWVVVTRVRRKESVDVCVKGMWCFSGVGCRGLFDGSF